MARDPRQYQETLSQIKEMFDHKYDAEIDQLSKLLTESDPGQCFPKQYRENCEALDRAELNLIRASGGKIDSGLMAKLLGLRKVK